MTNPIKKAAVCFLLAFQAAISLGQIASRDLLEWNEFYRLSWEDFQGERSESSIGDAGTFVSIKAKPYVVKNTVMYDVYAYFNRNKSWASDRSAELLEHEQLHFDIAELYARKIRKRISELKRRGVNDVKRYNDEIKTLLEASNMDDVQYDLETLHGALPKKQLLWKTKVKKELEELDDFKKEKKVIGRAKNSKSKALKVQN
jgi:hypothetical protein